MAEVKYIGSTNDGARFDTSQVQVCGITCSRCGWMGSQAMLKRAEGETEDACPECESPDWEPID